MSEPNNPEALKEIFDELFTLLEGLETQSTAALAYLKQEGRATDKKLQPHLEQAANASSVKWRAARLRMEYLLTPIKTKSTTEEKSGSPGTQEAGGGKKEGQGAGSYEKYLHGENEKEPKSEDKTEAADKEKEETKQEDKHKTAHAETNTAEKGKKQVAGGASKGDGESTHDDMKAVAKVHARESSGGDNAEQKSKSGEAEASKAAAGKK